MFVFVLLLYALILFIPPILLAIGTEVVLGFIVYRKKTPSKIAKYFWLALFFFGWLEIWQKLINSF